LRSTCSRTPSPRSLARARLRGYTTPSSRAGEGSDLPELLQRNEPKADGAIHGAPQPLAGSGGLGTGVRVATDREVRDELRRQIAALERRLGELFASSFPRQGIEWGVGAAGGPRVLGVGDLERVRDALAARLQRAQKELGRRGKIEEDNRGTLEAMIADPDKHRWVLISNEDIGEQGCRHWHARPRWGILGMLLNWWRVRVSSGCPLAGGRRPVDQETQAQTPGGGPTAATEEEA
jgi:hypothetical protein